MKPRIAFFVTDLQGGGAQRITLRLAAAFLKAGFKVDLVLARARGRYLKDVPKGIRITNLNSQSVAGIFKLVRYLNRNKPDVLMATMNYATITSLIAKRIARVPTKVIVRQASLLKQTGRLRRIFVRSIMKTLYPKADSIIAISKKVADELSEIGIRKSRIKTLKNPAVTSEIAKLARANVKLPSGPVIVSAGRLTAHKDFSTLIQAMALLDRKVSLIILGNGPQNRKIRRLARKLGVKVQMPGFDENPYRYFSKASVVVMPSSSEAFGNVAVEAMACGTPAIVTAESGASEAVEKSMIVPAKNPEALAEKLEKVITNPQSKASLAKLADKYSASRCVPEYLRVVKSLLSTETFK